MRSMKKKLLFGLSAALMALVIMACPTEEPVPEPTPPNSELPAPANVRGEATQNTIAVSWSPVTEALSYKVYAGTSVEGLEEKTNTTELAYTITGLSPGTRYYIAVSAVDSIGEGNKSSPIPVTTLQQNAVETKYDKEFLGEWLRMDTGDKWYISSTAIKINNQESSKTVSLHKDSERVIKVTEGGQVYYLFGFRIANATFTGRIVEFREDAPSGRALSGGNLAGIGVTISSLDERVTELTTTDPNGRYVADDIIPGDDYTVTPEGGTPTKVTPQFDGEDIGTITVTQGVNLKIRIVPQSSEVDMAFLYAGETYGFNLEIENTGDRDCVAPNYTLDFENAVTSSPSSGIIGTIEPGTTKTIPLSLRYLSTLKAYEVHRIGIRIIDLDKTWEDSVSLKIHKGTVNFNIHAGGNNPIQGIIIGPNARVWYFKNTNYRAAVPTSEEDYWVIFSGATVDTETVYSLGIGVNAPDSTGFIDTRRYEPNDTEPTATMITGNQIMAYLHRNDIDFYRVNLTGLGNITIPSLTDESISGFLSGPITLSKSGTDSSCTITIDEGYTSYKWYVDDRLRGTARSFTLNAAHYSLGKHTLTLAVYKNGVPYSKEQFFTVAE
jgi:hypothetical protein